MMIWILAASFVAGGLLARRVTIIALVPATFVVVVIAIAVGGEAKTADIWSIVLTTVVAGVGLQVGYFLSLVIQYGLRTLLVRGSSPLDAIVMARADRHGENRQLPR